MFSRSFNNLIGINYRNLKVVQPHNRRKYFPQADDKLLTKELLDAAGVPVPVTLAVIESFVDIENVWSALSMLDDLVIKPSRGKAGGGILVLQKNSDGIFITPSGRRFDRNEIFKHIGDILFGVYSFGNPTDRVLVEERIVPHSFFYGIYEQGVADIRIILLDGNPLMAMLRIPTKRSDGKANLHQGAIGIAVSLQDGCLTFGSIKGQSISRHPDSGVLLAEKTIPQWPAVIEAAIRAAGCVNLGYIGVDMVIDEKRGPLVLEINARPGLEIQVVNNLGLRSLLETAL